MTSNSSPRQPEKLEVELYSNATNAPVMRYPNRHYPGILIQGDSLSNLFHMAHYIEQVQKSEIVPDGETLTELIAELTDHLQRYVEVYERTLQAYEMPLPPHMSVIGKRAFTTYEDDDFDALESE